MIHQTAIIGAGFGGIGAAIRLAQAGLDDFLILERAGDVGGTWRDNHYPGAACDIPSNLYSFSFAPNPEWSRTYSGAAEILAYVKRLVSDHGLMPKVRLRQEVTELRFDAAAALWVIRTSAGDTFRARSVIKAVGALTDPAYPDLEGLERFAGHRVHSARWDHDYDFAGKRVAVIGTGASAVQLIPTLVRRAAHVKVFQRTPSWVLPRADRRIPRTLRATFRRAPVAQAAMREALFWGHEAMALAIVWNSPFTRLAERAALWHLGRQVKDPWLRRQLTPRYRIGCKRVLMSNDYYPALQRPNCTLVTWPIVGLAERGIRTAEGIEHRADCVVFATGFDVRHTRTPFPVIGTGGRLLSDEWRRGAQAYKSVNVAGYPNLHFILGPNSGPGHNSALVYMESQIDYAVQAIRTLGERGLRMMDVKRSVQTRHNERLQRRLAKTNWSSGCKSWYLSEDGFNGTMYPGFATQFAAELRSLRLGDYHLERQPKAARIS